MLPNKERPLCGWGVFAFTKIGSKTELKKLGFFNTYRMGQK